LIPSVYTSGQQLPYKLIPPQYELEHIKLNNKQNPGLFNDIIEDKEGYLWLNSTNGLHVFDGHITVTYSNGNKIYPISPDSASNIFSFFSQEQAGNFWTLEDNKRIIQFNPAKRSLVDSFSKKGTPDDNYYMLPASADYGLFFLLRNQKKNNFSICRKTGKEAFKTLYDLDFNPGNNFYYYLVDSNHWLLHNGNIIRLPLDGKKAERYTYPGGTMSHFFVFANNKSIYFTGSKQQAIYTWNKKTDKLEFFLTLPANIAGKIQAFYIEDSTLFIGSNLNLFIIDKPSKTLQDLSPQFVELAKKEAPGSLSEPLTKFFRQKDGTLLLETLTNIYRLKKKVPALSQFRQQVDAENTFSKLISYRALTEDENRNIYVSYYTGISKKSPRKETFSPLHVKQYMNDARISTYSLNYWDGHLLWNNVKIEIATGKYSYLFDSTFSGHCTQFLQHDSLWLFKWGTRLLHCYDLKHNTLNSYPLELEISTGAVAGGITDMNDIVADASGQNLWIGSRDFGLSLITKKGNLIKQLRHKELSISDDYITDLELVGEQLWFGCTDGLGVLNTETGRVKIYKNPVINNGLLKNRVVFSIQPDTIGNFYLGSNYGLIYFDTKAATFYNLAEGHPLSAVEFNRASVFKSSDNRYYFGSTDGLYSFTPGELEFYKSSNAIKAIKLYGISIFSSRDNTYNYLSENLDALGKLTLNPFDNTIEFSFSVPEFYRDVYYSYRIKGQSENWTEYKPDNKILLYGLQPGNYILEVKASASLNDSNASYYSLPIEMKQVWYKRSWVIVLFSLLTITAIIGFLRFRFNQKIKRQKDLADLRTKISSDLHDDVGTILSGLAMQSQMLTYTANEEQKESLNEISTMSRDAMEHMRDTVWAMDSRKDKYENLIDRMRAFAEKNLAMKNMTHEFIISDVDTKKFIDPEKRQSIYLIFKEATTNIIKHCDGKHVTITFAHVKNNLYLTIHDNGPEKEGCNSDGLGLSNMKMRAKKIGGELLTGYDNGFWVRLTIV
jgi:two-component sensor histidine kinase